MRKLLILSCGAFLVICTTSVALAEQTRVSDEASKSYIMNAEELVMPIINVHYDYSGDHVMAVMPEQIVIPGGKIEYLKNVKLLSVSPEVDKKWVWWFSMISNK